MTSAGSGPAGSAWARLVEAVTTAVSGHIRPGSIPGAVLAVAHAGRSTVVAVGSMAVGGPPMTPRSLFRIASLTKPVAAVATVSLVEDGVLRLDEPVRNWLPELARPRVLRHPEAELDDTVPVSRPITVRDLLTMTLGTGAVLAPPGQLPIQRAMEAAGLAPGPDPSPLGPDRWLARLAGLPLIRQPGEAFFYHTGFEVLGILLARAGGMSLGQLLTERVFAPLGMTDTCFTVPRSELSRLTTVYRTDPNGSGLISYDEPDTSRWAVPPGLESAGGGLVSTAGDYLAFARMLLREGEQVLSAESVRAMTTDALSEQQRDSARPLLGRASTWGLGVEINRSRAVAWMTPGRFGWSGGLGTTAYVDPSFDLIGILMTQRLMDDPHPPGVITDFWRALYRSI